MTPESAIVIIEAASDADYRVEREAVDYTPLSPYSPFKRPTKMIWESVSEALKVEQPVTGYESKGEGFGDIYPVLGTKVIV